MGGSFGPLFGVTTFGQSHGGGMGVVIDGCPPNHKKTSEFKIPNEFVPPPSVAMAAGDKIKPRLADNKEMRKSFIAPFRLWLIFGQTSETKARKLLTRNPRLVMETLVQRASRKSA